MYLPMQMHQSDPLSAINQFSSETSHGTISPLDGRGPEQIKIAELLERVKAGGIKEIIIATNPTVDGETTALYLAKILKPYNIKTTRLAYGIPVGEELDYADEMTLFRAIDGRKEL